MSEKILPFNIDILQLTDALVQGIKPVTVLDIFENNSKDFHNDGLFSTEIFGKVGSSDRTRKFSYIQLNASIMHPIIYKIIVDLKGYYEDIMKGKQYAIFDKVNKEFVKSNEIEGKTGFIFFLSHLEELSFQHTQSNRRDLKIVLFEKYKNKCLTDKIVVIPAGYRDFIIDKEGKPTEDEINGIYRKFISKNNLLSKDVLKSNNESLGQIVYSLQETFNELYTYIKNMLDGKNKLILGKWAARRVYNTTRNVASAPVIEVHDLDDESNVKVDQTQIGLYQYIKASLPITIHLLRDKFLSNVFVGENDIKLINQKTLQSETIPMSNDTIKKWTTDDGLEKLITSFSEEASRNLPVIIDDHYLCLIWEKDNKFSVIFDPSILKEEDLKYVHPITYSELYYITVAIDSRNRVGFVNRYPVINFGSIYPTYIYLRTTSTAKRMQEVSYPPVEGEVLGDYYQYPDITNDRFFDTIGVSPVHLFRLGMDFDGDTGSFMVMFSDQSKEEIDKLLDSPIFYKDFNENANFGSGYDTVKYVVENMTA